MTTSKTIRRTVMPLMLCLIAVPAAQPIGASAAVAAPAVAQVCRGDVCDGQRDPAGASQDTILQTAVRDRRGIELHVSYADGGMAWADIKNGNPDDLVWLDRTFDGGTTWDPHLGLTAIPAGGTSWRTQMYWISDVGRRGMVRACGTAGDPDKVGCTAWLPVCRTGQCDGTDPAGVAERTPNARAWVWYRKIVLHVSADGVMVWASIDNLDTTRRDEVWLDRTWSTEENRDGPLGATAIPPGRSGWRTLMYNFDDPTYARVGAVRACGRAQGATEIACTPWVRGAENPPDLYSGAVDVLMGGYNSSTGMWGPGEPEKSVWLSANAFTALLDYMARTGDRRYYPTIAEMGRLHPSGLPDKPWPGEYYDDDAWWALAWIRAYDLTGDPGYLDLAEGIADRIRMGWSERTCGGGISWIVGDDRTKNAITNGLYLKLSAGLHRRGKGAGRWLAEARRTWAWFRVGPGNALIGTAPGLVKDKLEDNGGGCRITNANTYTYLQGVLAGGLAELYRSVREPALLRWASGVVNASLADLLSNGVLYYRVEELADDGDGLKDVRDRIPSDGTAFKGAFVRNLRELYDVSVSAGAPTGNWRGFLLRQQQALLDEGRSGWNEFGMHWAGPVKLGRNITFGTQMSAVDAFNAAHNL